MGLYKAKEVWTGTLASSIPDGTTTSFTLTSSSGLTDGETYVFTIDRVDTNGTKTPNKKEVIIGTVSGSNVINCTRGVEGTAQAHSSGAIVEILFTAKHWNDLIESFKAQHRGDGTHSKIQGLDNNQAITQKDNTGTAREIAKIDSSNVLTIGNNTTPIKIKAGSNTTSGHTVPNVADDTFALLSNLNDSIYRQAIINGNFDIWQRATSAAGGTSSPYVTSADRWNNFRSGGVSGSTFSRQDGTGVPGSRYCMRVQRDSGNTSTAAIMLGQAIETANSIFLRGKKLTLSFWARKGADYSASGSILQAGIGASTAIDESFAANSSFIKSQNFTLTTSWQKFTLTTDNVIASDVNTVKVGFIFYPTGTAGANDYYEITQVQLCAGEVDLPFQPKSFDDELKACLRYFYNPLYNVTSNYPPVCPVYVVSSTYGVGRINFPLPMRTTPTLSVGTISSFKIGYPAPNIACSNITLHPDGKTPIYCILELSFTGATAGLTQNLYRDNNSSAYIYFDAEL
jgi:hypothetical protein